MRSPLFRLSKFIFSGVIAVAPIAGTLWLVYMLCRLLMQVGEAMVRFTYSLWSENELESVAGLPGIEVGYVLLPLLALGLLGGFVSAPIGKQLVGGVSAIMRRLPLVRFVYNSLQQFVSAVRNLGGEERKFKSVVYVEYPSPGCRLIGFVTGNYFDTQMGKDVTSVFVPTSPNPLTGFLLIVEDEKVQASDLTVEQATKTVLSAGLVTPDKNSAQL